MTSGKRQPFSLGSAVVAAGRRGEAELPVAKMITGSPLSIPVLVLHGANDGPTVWINAAIHGDELNGVEIIRRVLELLDPRRMSGTVLAVPVVNLPGFMNGSRYLPDRRDLNRSFPGSPRGSLASRIAHLFTTEIVARSTVGIDLHTGSDHRSNLPQVRADLDDAETMKLATAFGAPVMIHAPNRSGSLRQTGTERGATVLLYEGGEAWRFDERSIRTGVGGVMRVLAELDIAAGPTDDQAGNGGPSRFMSEAEQTMVSRSTRWIRARRTGIAQLQIDLGATVERGEVIGLIHDSYGHRLSRIIASTSGTVVGVNLDPIVNQGDAMIHLAEPTRTDEAGETSTTSTTSDRLNSTNPTHPSAKPPPADSDVGPEPQGEET